MRKVIFSLLLFITTTSFSLAQIDSLQNELYKFSLDELTELDSGRWRTYLKSFFSMEYYQNGSIGYFYQKPSQ